MQPSVVRVLLVCTGNSCRSPMAEGILRKLLREEGVAHVVVESAGTMAPEGVPPTSYTILVTTEQGVNISEHRSRSLTKELVESADLVLVMERVHRRFVENLSPSAGGKVFLLKEYGTENDAEEVDDPIGRDLDFYRECYRELEDEIRRILPRIVTLGQADRGRSDSEKEV